MCELLAEEPLLRGRAGVGCLRKDLGPELGTSADASDFSERRKGLEMTLKILKMM